MPGDLEWLRQVQEYAGELPWPSGLEGSPEALALMGELMHMPGKAGRSRPDRGARQR